MIEFIYEQMQKWMNMQPIKLMNLQKRWTIDSIYQY